MLSAYREGNLKKNPLLGTSLAVDPDRQAMRQGFMDLYGLAKQRGAGEGRQGMLSELADQYSRLGQIHTPRLSQIPQEYAAIASEAGSYTDPEKLKKLSQRSATANKYLKDLAAISNKKGKKKMSLAPEYKAEVDAAYKAAGGTGDKNRFTKDYVSRMASEYEDYTRSAKERAQALYASKYTPIAEEETQRRRILQDRADLYNAFLGMD